MDGTLLRTMPAFLVDRNAGRLVKWLRAFGFDAEFADDGADGQLVARALREGRTLVTKDRRMLDRRVIANGELPVVVITADRLDQQLREFFSVVPLQADLHFSRCMRCNVLLRAVAKQDVRALVPPYVYAHHDAFSRCPQCGRVYWQGTHWEHMENVLQEAMADA